MAGTSISNCVTFDINIGGAGYEHARSSRVIVEFTVKQEERNSEPACIILLTLNVRKVISLYTQPSFSFNNAELCLSARDKCSVP